MGNPQLGHGAAADSINWVGYLTTQYNDTTVLSYNHAVSGATVNNSIVASDHDVPQDLVYQVLDGFERNYCPPHIAGLGWRAEEALFGVWIGINDIYFAYQLPDPLEILSRVLQSYFNLVDHLHACGARDFLVFNIPPCDRTPNIVALKQSERELYESVTAQFNNRLRHGVEEWRSANPDSTMRTYDAWSFFTEILDNPQQYGFVDSTCIGYEQGCLWWDDFHSVSAFHNLLAADVGRFLVGRPVGCCSAIK
ncbi:hypothetical protein ASPSYDRAFT_41714 [Aspergillus sydowii CBS 593.65]|uniref:SGNH hydrolase-type esterase domain-containing protein n=1 Tax=Aspergillus sydowii CBS 593.65 TaxID=1036612 RepID=A0A1L9TUA7_9EURO|nr:uncharacterized protein ASPSYDRAFT_41714 [Aspergillus sydowii CBS 593.65]OJJ63017.1 hypothetical protein ASPSYDRAFT_41714 [Aspergillus sydowii CBS 593.65]